MADDSQVNGRVNGTKSSKEQWARDTARGEVVMFSDLLETLERGEAGECDVVADDGVWWWRWEVVVVVGGLRGATVRRAHGRSRE
jgi:hypothetical protein